jgi:hypothetical protein
MRRTGINRKNLLFSLCLAIPSCLLAILAGEAILRILDIPGISFRNQGFDDVVGVTYLPHSQIIYRNDRGDCVRREVNSWGYTDVEHEVEKPEGAYRIGFFGDSYTEAVQVRLEDTFQRLIEDSLSSHGVECFTFGHSGFGTLQAYLESERWSDFFDLDLIIYVFCENDPGDNIKAIARNDFFPFAVLSEDTLRIDCSFRDRYRYKQRLYYRMYDYLSAHSLVFATFGARLKLLFNYGIKISVSEEDRTMTAKFHTDRENVQTPSASDLPSSWPAHWKEYAKVLDERIILQWKEFSRINSRAYAIVYIPRPTEMSKPAVEQDSWKAWLVSLCESQQIPLIDPTRDLLAVNHAGGEAFYDHLTQEGHRALAGAFLRESDRIRRIPVRTLTRLSSIDYLRHPRHR